MGERDIRRKGEEREARCKLAVRIQNYLNFQIVHEVHDLFDLKSAQQTKEIESSVRQ